MGWCLFVLELLKVWRNFHEQISSVYGQLSNTEQHSVWCDADARCLVRLVSSTTEQNWAKNQATHTAQSNAMHDAPSYVSCFMLYAVLLGVLLGSIDNWGKLSKASCNSHSSVLIVAWRVAQSDAMMMRAPSLVRCLVLLDNKLIIILKKFIPRQKNSNQFMKF